MAARKKPRPVHQGKSRSRAAASPPRKQTARAAKEPGRAGRITVVGVGASAGGLEAFTELLGNLSDDTGMAFVLLSHLGDASFLSDLLSRATAMPVRQVGQRTPVEPNHVYVIPPLKYLTIRDGVLTSHPLGSERRPVMVIDHFLLSLAEDQKDRAIGVILSGTGSDGTLGLAAIRGQGGLAFVQDFRSALYADMPSHAASNDGCSDFVLPPGEIAKELGRIARHPLAGDAAAAEVADASELDELLELVQAGAGLDFREYKPATVHRRVTRRMLLNDFHTLPEYVSYARSNPEEIDALHRDILINVTGFFRDPGAFDFLSRKVLPGMVGPDDSKSPIRVWVSGCSTGEEAYTIAILLSEALAKAKSGRRVQIFATDVSEASIRRAREGIYPANIAADVSRARLNRFFVDVNGFYQVKQFVRDMCVFAVQNVIRDAPFSRMDLISCRNLLIYLGSRLQERALATFHYALKPGAFLLLGVSETPGASDLFRQIDKKQRVFMRQDAGDLPTLNLETGFRTRPERHLALPGTGPEDKSDLGREIDRLLVDRWGPAGVLVDSRFDVVEFRGNTGMFLEPAPGRASLNLLRMARESFSTDLRGALQEAHSKGAPVRRDRIRLRTETGEVTVGFEVVPLGKPRFPERHYLVVFQVFSKEEPPAGKPARTKSRASAAENEIGSLRHELVSTRADLRAVIEELEHKNEDLQSANEEILSANEELQSTNEELETAKEELQATNEELTTVNQELNNRNADLDEANNDLVNLLGSVDVIILMIGNDLSIRRFTPNAREVMRLIPTDVGRPLADIKSHLEVSNLEKRILRVIRTMSAEQMEVQDGQGRWYTMRIRPYRTADNRIDGAVLTLVDVTDAEEALRLLLEDTPDFILDIEPMGRVLFINRTLVSLAKEVETGENFLDYLKPKGKPAARACLERVARTGTTAEFRTQGVAGKDPGQRMATRVSAVKKDGVIRALAVKTGGPAL